MRSDFELIWGQPEYRALIVHYHVDKLETVQGVQLELVPGSGKSETVAASAAAALGAGVATDIVPALPSGCDKSPLIEGPTTASEVEVPLTWSIFKIGALLGLGLMFLSISALLINTAFALTGMYLGLTLFFFSNYASARLGEPYQLVGPAGAALGVLVSFLLAVTAAVAALTG